MAFNFDLLVPAELKNGEPGVSVRSEDTEGQQTETLLSVLTEASLIEHQGLGDGTTGTFYPSKKGSVGRRCVLKRALDRAGASQHARAAELNRMAKIAMSRHSEDVVDVSFEPEPREETKLDVSISHPPSSLLEKANETLKVSAIFEDVLATPLPEGSSPLLSPCPRAPHQRKPSISSEGSNVSSVDLIAAICSPTVQNDAPRVATPKKQQEFQCKPRYSADWLWDLSHSEATASRGGKKKGELLAMTSFSAGASLAAATNKPSSKGAHLLGRLSSMSKLTPSLSSKSLPKAARRLNKSLTSLADKNASVDLSTASSTASSKIVRPCANDSWDVVPSKQGFAVCHTNNKMSPLNITQRTIQQMEQAISVAKQHGAFHRSDMQESRKGAYNNIRSSPSEVSTLPQGSHSSESSSFKPKPPSIHRDCFSSRSSEPSMLRINKSMGSLGLMRRMKGGSALGGNDTPRRCNADWDVPDEQQPQKLKKLSRQNGSRSSFGSMRMTKKVSPNMLNGGVASPPGNNASWSI